MRRETFTVLHLLLAAGVAGCASVKVENGLCVVPRHGIGISSPSGWRRLSRIPSSFMPRVHPSDRARWPLGTDADAVFISPGGDATILLTVRGVASQQYLANYLRLTQHATGEISDIFRFDYRIAEQPKYTTPDLLASADFRQWNEIMALRCTMRYYFCAADGYEPCVLDLTLLSKTASFQKNLATLEAMVGTIGPRETSPAHTR